MADTLLKPTTPVFRSRSCSPSFSVNHKWQSTWELTPKELAKREKKEKRKRRKAEWENLFSLGISSSSKVSKSTAAMSVPALTVSLPEQLAVEATPANGRPDVAHQNNVESQNKVEIPKVLPWKYVLDVVVDTDIDTLFKVV